MNGKKLRLDEKIECMQDLAEMLMKHMHDEEVKQFLERHENKITFIDKYNYCVTLKIPTGRLVRTGV